MRITQPPNKYEVQNAKINALIGYRKLHPKNRPLYEFGMQQWIWNAIKFIESSFISQKLSSSSFAFLYLIYIMWNVTWMHWSIFSYVDHRGIKMEKIVSTATNIFSMSVTQFKITSKCKMGKWEKLFICFRANIIALQIAHF